MKKIIKLENRINDANRILNNEKILNDKINGKRCISLLVTLTGFISSCIIVIMDMANIISIPHILSLYLIPYSFVIGFASFLGYNIFCLNEDSYRNKILVKLGKLNRKKYKLEHDINKVNKQKIKLNNIYNIDEVERIIETEDPVIRDEIYFEQYTENTNYRFNEFSLGKEKVDDSYIDEMYCVFDSLKGEEIIFNGIKERPKSRKRTR